MEQIINIQGLDVIFEYEVTCGVVVVNATPVALHGNVKKSKTSPLFTFTALLQANSYVGAEEKENLLINQDMIDEKEISDPFCSEVIANIKLIASIAPILEIIIDGNCIIFNYKIVGNILIVNAVPQQFIDKFGGNAQPVSTYVTVVYHADGVFFDNDDQLLRFPFGRNQQYILTEIKSVAKTIAEKLKA